MAKTVRSTTTKPAARGPATELSALSIQDLVTFHAAADAAAEAWAAIANQPRAEGDRISEMLGDESDRANGMADAAIGDLLSRTPKDETEAKLRAQCVLRYAGDFISWAGVVQLVMGAAAMGKRGAASVHAFDRHQSRS